MRHRVAKKTLKRDAEHRRSMLRTMSTDLVMHEKIVTTLTKAKFVRPFFEKLITKARKGADFNNVKLMKANLNSKEAVSKMLDDVAPRFNNVNGGYTRIIKLPNRAGDNAPMARIELTKEAKKEKPASTKKPKKKSKSKKKVEKNESK